MGSRDEKVVVTKDHLKPDSKKYGDGASFSDFTDEVQDLIRRNGGAIFEMHSADEECPRITRVIKPK